MRTDDFNSVNHSDAKPFFDVYPNYDIALLPSWVQKNITCAHVYGNSMRNIILPDGRKYSMDNRLNCLTGREWMQFINSVFTTNYPTRGKEGYAHEIRRCHPTPKPPQLMRDIISFFTKEDELVLDTFMGVGGTLLGADLCGRKAIGIDLNKHYIDTYVSAAKALNLHVFPTICGDASDILQNPVQINTLLNDEEVSLMLIDPPYANMMSKTKTGGDIAVYGNNATPFTKDERDLGNMTYGDFLYALTSIVQTAIGYIKFRGYVVVFVKDLQPSKKEANLLHADVIQSLNTIPNLNYKGMKIWADLSTKSYPYGYPFSFVANQNHQFILIFRKEY